MPSIRPHRCMTLWMLQRGSERGRDIDNHARLVERARCEVGDVRGARLAHGRRIQAALLEHGHHAWRHAHAG